MANAINLAPMETSVSPQASSTGVYIATPNTSMWDHLADWAYKTGTEIATKEGEAQGSKDQAAATNGKLVSDRGTILNTLAGLFPGSKGYDQGATAQYATQKQVQLQDKVADLQTKFAADPTGFNNAFTAVKKDWLDSVPTDKIADFAKLADHTQINASAQIEAARVQRVQQQSAADLMQTADKLRGEVYDGILNGKLSPAQIDDRQVQLNTLYKSGVDQGFISPLQARQLADQSGFNIRQADILKAFRSNPSPSFIDAIKNGKETADPSRAPLTPEQRQHLTTQLTGEYNQIQHQALMGQAMAAASLKTQVNDALASVAATGQGGFSDTQIAAAFPKNTAAQAELKNKFTLASQQYEFTGAIGLTTSAEDITKLQTFMPKPGAVGFADSLATYQKMAAVVQNKWAQVNSDPAQYVMTQSPQIRDMITAQPASDSPADITTANQTRALGYEAMLALQTKLGVGPGQQSVLPKTQAISLAADLNVLDKDHPEAAANKIASLASQFGPQFPAVMRQMARLDQPLSPSFQVLATMIAPGDAQTRVDLSKALSMGDKELIDALDKRVPGVRKDIDTSTQKALTDFNATAYAQGDPHLAKIVNDAATSLAYYYGGRPGTSASSAAQQAVQAITGRYDFVGQIRVPKGTAPDVEIATGHAQASIDPSLLQPIRERPGEVLTPEQIRSIQLDQIKRGYWSTNADGDGAVLRYPNGEPVMVRAPNIQTTADAGTTVSAPVDVAVQNRAAAKKHGALAGNPANEVATDAVISQIQSKAQQRPYVPLEIKFKDAKGIAATVPQRVPTPIEQVLQ